MDIQQQLAKDMQLCDDLKTWFVILCLLRLTNGRLSKWLKDVMNMLLTKVAPVEITAASTAVSQTINSVAATEFPVRQGRSSSFS